MRTPPHLALAAISIAITACGMVAGIDGDYHELPSCESVGRQCVAAAPVDFNGPVVVLEATGEFACPPEFPDAVEDGGGIFQGLVAEAASCDCSCTPPTNPCTSAELAGYKEASCQGEPAFSVTLPAAEDCVAVDYGEATILEVTFQGCQPSATVTIPKATWDKTAYGCSAPTVATQCGEGTTCQPLPPAGARLCVYRSGDVACPSDYPERQLYHLGMDDTRGCDECDCGQLVGCGAEKVNLFSAAGCDQGDLIGTQEVSNCGVPPTVPMSAFYKATPNGSVSCAPKGGTTPTGTAKPKLPTTVCCTPG